jgi:CBS domain-containing protein
MTSRTINPIVQPCTADLPLEPSVALGEKVSRAIELMVSHDLDRIAVVRNRRAVGIVRLVDAFREIGLNMPSK